MDFDQSKKYIVFENHLQKINSEYVSLNDQEKKTNVALVDHIVSIL